MTLALGILRQRHWEITVDGLAVDALRVGFTIEKTLAKEPNTAEIAIYNLALGTRERFNKAEGVRVVVRAGYELTSLVTLFVGELREAFSKPEEDGSWITVLRAGDGDKALRKKRGPKGYRPGVSVERVISEQAKAMGIGIGNIGNELLSQIKAGKLSPEGLGSVFSKGFTGSGSFAAQFDKLMGSVGAQWSVQDGELQALRKGRPLAGMTAVVLSRTSGLEQTPSITAKGTLTCRARIQGGLMPGYPVIVKSAALGGRRDPKSKQHDISGIWVIDKARYIGDTHGQDWNVELECTEVKP